MSLPCSQVEVLYDSGDLSQALTRSHTYTHEEVRKGNGRLRAKAIYSSVLKSQRVRMERRRRDRTSTAGEQTKKQSVTSKISPPFDDQPVKVLSTNKYVYVALVRRNPSCLQVYAVVEVSPPWDRSYQTLPQQNLIHSCTVQ